LRFFGAVSLALLVPGVALGLRFLVHYVRGSGSGHVQSLILVAVLIIAGVVAGAVALLADLIAANRRILEQMEQHARLRALADATAPELLLTGGLLIRRTYADEARIVHGPVGQSPAPSEVTAHGGA
jgi:hypothetical protein